MLTRQEAIAILERVTVVPATRTIRDSPTEVRLGAEEGMPAECVLSFDNIRTVPQALLVERITSVPAQRLGELCGAMDRALGC